MVSLCFAQIRSLKRQKRRRALSSSMMKGKFLMLRSTRWKQDWLVAQENSNRDNYILPPRSSPSFSSVSGRPADWQLLGGCLLARNPGLLPLRSGGEGRVGGGDMPAASAQALRPGAACGMRRGCPDPRGRALSHFGAPLKFKLAKVLFQVTSPALGAH